MSNVKYLIFVIIAFVSVGLFLGAGELLKRISNIKKIRKIRKETFDNLFKVIFVVLIIGLAGLGFWFYKYQKGANLCKDKCISSFEGWRFFDENIPLIETNFDDQEECIEFCVSIFKDLQKEEWKSIDLKSIF